MPGPGPGQGPVCTEARICPASICTISRPSELDCRQSKSAGRPIPLSLTIKHTSPAAESCSITTATSPALRRKRSFHCCRGSDSRCNWQRTHVLCHPAAPAAPGLDFQKCIFTVKVSLIFLTIYLKLPYDKAAFPVKRINVSRLDDPGLVFSKYSRVGAGTASDIT